MKHPALLILLSMLFVQCTSVKKLMQQGYLVKSDIEQPFSFEYDNNLLYLDVAVNGRPKRFIIDSGAPTVISQELREELQLKKATHADISDSHGNSSKLEFVVLEHLAFGGVEVANSAALVTDLSLFHCMGIDGLIGANVMSRFDWEVDYQEEKIQLHHRDSPDLPRIAYDLSVPFKTTTQGTPELDIDIPGWLSASGVTFDLGSNGGISIYQPKALKIDKGGPFTYSYGQTSKGIFGARTDTAYYVLVDSLILGGSLSRPAMVTTFNTSNKIGNKFWSNYRLLISWSDKRLYLAPHKTTPPQLPPDLLRVGYEDGGVRVRAVFEKLARVDSRIAAGDAVLAIDGADTESIALEDYCALREQSGEEVRLTIRKKNGEAPASLVLTREEMGW